MPASRGGKVLNDFEARRESLDKLLPEDCLDVLEALFQGSGLSRQSQFFRQADGIVEELLGVAVTDARGAERVCLVHIVVGLLAQSLEMSESRQFSHAFFFRHEQVRSYTLPFSYSGPGPGLAGASGYNEWAEIDAFQMKVEGFDEQREILADGDDDVGGGEIGRASGRERG